MVQVVLSYSPWGPVTSSMPWGGLMGISCEKWAENLSGPCSAGVKDNTSRTACPPVSPPKQVQVGLLTCALPGLLPCLVPRGSGHVENVWLTLGSLANRGFP